MEKQTFIGRVGPLARADMQKTGVLASLTIAQAILESGWGTSELCLNANALFGIKADSRWSGRVYSKTTKECYDGQTFTDVDALFRAYDSWEESLSDHSAFLLAGSHYAAVIGEQDYKTACKAIKAAGYATDPEYAEKLISLIESNDLTAYDGPEKEETTLNIINSILTKNPCYTGGRKLDAVKGLMIHSVGCPQPSAQVFVKNWNSPSCDNVCVHAFIDANTGDVYQTLPWNWRGWHCASGSKGSGNNTHVGVEMCEPSTIKYTGGASWVETGDGSNTKAAVMRTYKAAVELFAHLCKEFNLDPLADGVIISHSEGYKRGIASNHGDVEHIWNKFGLTMSQFRQDIKAAMGGVSAAPSQHPTDTPTAGTGEIIVGDIVNFKGGPHYISASAASASTTPKAGPAKVTAISKGSKHPYHVIHTDATSTVYGWVDADAIEKPQTNAYPATPFLVKVLIDDLNYRSEGSMNGKIKGQTGKGTFTIVEVKDGWGRLKSGAGWIYLENPDYCTIQK